LSAFRFLEYAAFPQLGLNCEAVGLIQQGDFEKAVAALSFAVGR